MAKATKKAEEKQPEAAEKAAPGGTPMLEPMGPNDRCEHCGQLQSACTYEVDGEVKQMTYAQHLVGTLSQPVQLNGVKYEGEVCLPPGGWHVFKHVFTAKE